MATARARSTRKLKPWLLEQIESGKYPGLMWDDDKKTCFRIPWKHAGKQDFRHDEDAAIFKAWAMYKKKYQDGEKVAAAAWKTRLRCALNKSPEFQEVPDRSQLDISEPYKVYRIVPLEEQGMAHTEKQGRKRKGTADSRSSSSDETDQVEKKPHIVPLGIAIPEAPCSTSPEDSGMGSDLSNPDAPIVPQQIPELESPIHNRNLTTMTTILPTDVLSHETHRDTRLKVTLIYSGIEVAQKVVESGECKLSAKAPPEGVYQGMEHVLLPVPGEQFKAEIRQNTERLLSVLHSGVMLASNADGIFAQRQKSCSGRIYWTGPSSDSQGVINKLERDVLVRLFDTDKFMRALAVYKAEGGTPPDYYVTLCFGEEISEVSHTTNKLITAKIEQVLASEMVQQATESLCAAEIPDPFIQNPSSPYLIPLLPVTTLDSIPEYSR
ncbi:interferon regulatory factor 9 [Leptodactylus fuscus]|uniref:interferon regulatory factor 9 n=1 Tax=Leptodactylus fuscus TaxID=238119 RepID=UPI003F4E7732